MCKSIKPEFPGTVGRGRGRGWAAEWAGGPSWGRSVLCSVCGPLALLGALICGAALGLLSVWFVTGLCPCPLSSPCPACASTPTCSSMAVPSCVKARVLGLGGLTPRLCSFSSFPHGGASLGEWLGLPLGPNSLPLVCLDVGQGKRPILPCGSRGLGWGPLTIGQ